MPIDSRTQLFDSIAAHSIALAAQSLNRFQYLIGSASVSCSDEYVMRRNGRKSCEVSERNDFQGARGTRRARRGC